MPVALVVTPALILAGVLVASGIGKLRHPDDLGGWAELGVPAALRRDWLRRLHPWGEIALGLAVLVLGGWLGAAAGAIAALLMVTYLVLIVRMLRARPDASCACFGDRRPVTRVTVVRNAWYVALTLAVASTTWTTALIGGPLSASDASGWMWVAGATAAAVTVALTLWPAPLEPALRGSGQLSATASDLSSDEPLDYQPTRTPAVQVSFADGTSVNLRELSMTAPTLLLAVKPGCGPCEQALAEVPQWRELLPEVQIRLLLEYEPIGDAFAERGEPQSLHDPHRYVRDSISDWRTPAAVLLGGDGMIAGGPEVGFPAIEQFIGDIYESLHGKRPVTRAQ